MEFSELVALFEQIDSTTKRGEKTSAIANMLAKCDVEEIKPFVLLLQGRVFAAHDTRKLGISVNYIIKALERVSGYTKDEITIKWSKLGDIGNVAQDILQKKKQSTLFNSSISIQKIFVNLQKLPAVNGNGAVEQKMQLISDLLSGCNPTEAKYMIRIILEVLRVGIGEGILRDAIVWAFYPKLDALCTVTNGRLVYSNAFTAGIDEPSDILKYESLLTSLRTIQIENFEQGKSILDASENDLIITKANYELCRELYNKWVSDVQNAIDVTNDVAKVATLAAKKDMANLRNMKPSVGKPLQVMLAKKATDVNDALSMVGTPCYIEYKYDGFRMQIHKDGPKINLFTRKLEEVTMQFPDVVSAVASQVNCQSCILDAEVVGYDAKSGKYTPFQHISQRIRRKYEIHALASQLPVEVNVFDILALNSENLIDSPLNDRRNLLFNIIKPKKKVLRLSELMEIDSAKQAEEFYAKSLAAGNEGIMFKKKDAPYKPGSRVGFMIKLKPVMDTLDLVVTQATWGEGKRANWLTSFVISCVNENGELLEMGRCGTGFKELENDKIEAENGESNELVATVLDVNELSFAQMTRMIEPLIISQKGKEVIIKPEIILEIAYEEIQKSTAYSSGFALRFPRVIGLRDTRSVENASTIDVVEDYYYAQKKRQ